jgi:hypothetical protein
LFGTSFVSLAALDLVAGGVRSTVPRFIVPAYLALAVAFGYLIFRGLESSSRAAQLGALGLAVGAVACAIGSYAEETSARVWWNQDDGAAPENRTVADAVNRRPGALLLATGGGALLELSNYVRPDTRVRLVLDGRPPRIRPGSQDVFAYGSPATAVAAKRLRRLLDSLRRRGTAVERLSPEPACCGADIRRLPDQFWRVSER